MGEPFIAIPIFIAHLLLYCWALFFPIYPCEKELIVAAFLSLYLFVNSI